MFTKQDLEWLLELLGSYIFHGSAEDVKPHFERYESVREKLDLLMADHPEDEEAGKKPAAKKPAAKKPVDKKPAAKKPADKK